MKKVCFDTSVLVAALLEQHPQHPRAFSALLAVHQKKVLGFITTHGLAELYATLTALPLKPRLTPANAHRMLQNSVMGHLKLIPLTPKLYADAIDLTVRQGLSSGAIYDSLHLIGARASCCDQLLTFNYRHFQVLAPGDSMVAQP